MPVQLPSSGYDAANWPATAARLNAEQAVWPSLPDDGGGRYLGRLGNSFGAVAVSPDQFATSSHVAPRAGKSEADGDKGYVEFAGDWHRVTACDQDGDFAILTVAGQLPRWCAISFAPPAEGYEPVIAWGFGKGFNPGAAPYESRGVTVYPSNDETRALR